MGLLGLASSYSAFSLTRSGCDRVQRPTQRTRLECRSRSQERWRSGALLLTASVDSDCRAERSAARYLTL